jgi:transcriptional regulator with XRE-family HTH domain
MTLTVTMAVDLGTVLRIWRADSHLTLKEMEEEVNKNLPPSVFIGRETIRRYEQNKFPVSGPDPVVIAAITTATEHQMSELPQPLRDDADNLVELLIRSRCIASSVSYNRRSTDLAA